LNYVKVAIIMFKPEVNIIDLTPAVLRHISVAAEWDKGSTEGLEVTDGDCIGTRSTATALQ